MPPESATASPAPAQGGESTEQSAGQRSNGPRPPPAPYQDGVTILTPIKPGRIAALTELLRTIGSDVEGNSLVPFPRLTRVHFCRFVVLEESRDALGKPTPASLVFSSNFDGTADQHLDELYDVASAGLASIYEHCEGYPAPGNQSRDSVVGYLKKHNVGYNTLYIGTWGRTVQQIHREAELRDRLQVFLDSATRNADFLARDPATIRSEIQEFVRREEDLAWAIEPPPTLQKIWPRRRDVRVLLILLVIAGGLLWSISGGLRRLLLLLLPVGFVGWWVITLRRKEKTDEQYPIATDFEHVARISQQEDRFVQNQMSAVNNIKPGWFRLFTLRTVLLAIDVAARYIYTKGTLGSIPSIHFGRWVIIDGGRRLVFFSNFDGSWENYLGDFIDKAAAGLTAVWSNTYGFPRSRFLLRDGATDEQRFKAFGRNSQVVTQVWYTAYKWLSVQNINNNSAIRAGLFGVQTPEETAAWLRRL